MGTASDLTVQTAAGGVRGIRVDGVSAFRGIPYAEPPIGERRFTEPVPPRAWTVARSAEAQAVAPPQISGRGDPILGELPVPGYDEDCLTLNVWTPAPDEQARLPVLVWIHGGGLMFHAGSASFYDGAVMAKRGNLVVVTVNYRLGALGWLSLPGGTAGPDLVANLGLLDQCLALEWVRDNISAFGGDPTQVTVAGQSAGGVSIVALAAAPRAKGLFQRVILQSSGLQMPARTLDAAIAATGDFVAAAGLDGVDADALRALPVSKVLEAQAATIMQSAQRLGFDPLLRPMALLPFRHVADGNVLPIDHIDAARNGSMDHLDVLLMITSQEYRFVYAMDDAFWLQDRTTLVARLAAAWGAETAEAMFSHYEASGGSASPAEVYVDMLCQEGSRASYEIADRRAALGLPVHFAIFDWRSPGCGGRIGAAHTVELPFVFNNFEHWSGAPAVNEVDPAELVALGNEMQDEWIAFIRTGSPSRDWPAYTAAEPVARQFGSGIQYVRNPGDGRLGLTDFMRIE